jgi:glycosyltransferase involved in cell wall biosynthesis
MNTLRERHERGHSEFVELLCELRQQSLADGAMRSNALVIRTGNVVIDVTHTARHDLHTGIQRVVREAVSRWLRDGRCVLVWWDDAGGILRELGTIETYRFRDWSNHLPKESDTEPQTRNFDSTPDGIVVPWDSIFLLPELAADPRRSSCYSGLALSGVVDHIGAIGYDLVPVTAAETVHEGMVRVFPTHLSAIKHATRLSAISESAANEFRAWRSALAAQGLAGPEVATHSLPPTPFVVDESEVVALRNTLGSSDFPVVLVVGSREPRKNQIAVLEAARGLWQSGHRFHLVMVGGSGWNSGDIDREIDRLRAMGVDIVIRTRAGESELFAWYRVARFTMFPSLYEGFGLPIAESLGVGTPVITSDYGAMSEVAAPGGALLVDPRDPREIRAAMEQLLTDDDLLADLREQALRRDWPSWDGYADAVWHHLVGGDGAPAL